MTAVPPDRILAELGQLRPADTDPGLDAIRMALLIEDVLGVTLADDQIDPAVLGDPNTLRRMVIDSTPAG